MYKTILFDLDGTLTDSMIGITRSIQYALKKFNIAVNDLSQLTHFIGPPLHQSFMENFNLSSKDANRAVKYYREYFSERGAYENSLYPGVRQLLKKLYARQLDLFVVTAKPTMFAEMILEHFGLEKYFIDVIGSNLNGTMTDKSELILSTIQKHELCTQSILMVGDREYDIRGANVCKIDSIAVGFGYGSTEELQNASPTYFAKTIENLSEILDKLTILDNRVA